MVQLYGLPDCFRQYLKGVTTMDRNNIPMHPGAMSRNQLRRYRWRKFGEVCLMFITASAFAALLLWMFYRYATM